MREIVTVTKVFPYDELSDQAKIVAREQLVDQLTNLGIVTEAMRQIAANWLSNEGWQEFAELAEGENIVSEEDANRLQFSVAHVQSDFVVWKGTRPVGGWTDDGTEVTVATEIYYGSMSVEITDPPESWNFSDLNDALHLAGDMVREHQDKVLAELHKYDLELVDDEEYLADFATANEIEFTEDGYIYR